MFTSEDLAMIGFTLTNVPPDIEGFVSSIATATS